MTTSGVTRVYLARHGRTALNAEGRLHGLSDPPLDDIGLGEVARLAAVLAVEHPTVVVCSPLQRAVATEPRPALAERARRAFFELVAELGPGPVAMVSHDAFNGATLAQRDPALDHVRQRTACWNQLSLIDGVWRVDSYDQIAGQPG